MNNAFYSLYTEHRQKFVSDVEMMEGAPPMKDDVIVLEDGSEYQVVRRKHVYSKVSVAELRVFCIVLKEPT